MNTLTAPIVLLEVILLNHVQQHARFVCEKELAAHCEHGGPLARPLHGRQSC